MNVVSPFQPLSHSRSSAYVNFVSVCLCVCVCMHAHVCACVCVRVWQDNEPNTLPMNYSGPAGIIKCYELL